MATRTQGWHPLHLCECHVEEEYEEQPDPNEVFGSVDETTSLVTLEYISLADQKPPPPLNKSLRKVFRQCWKHAQVNPQDLLTVLSEESSVYGRAVAAVHEGLDKIYKEDVTDGFGEVVGQKLAQAHPFRAYFDIDRKLVWNVRKLDPADVSVTIALVDTALAGASHTFLSDEEWEKSAILTQATHETISALIASVPSVSEPILDWDGNEVGRALKDKVKPTITIDSVKQSASLDLSVLGASEAAAATTFLSAALPKKDPKIGDELPGDPIGG